MKIGELAQATGTQVETIRFYERQGLLPAPRRSGGNYRDYDAVQAQRLRFIRHCRALDMGLDEIRVLLRLNDAPAEDCTAVNALLDEHIGHVSARLLELSRLRKALRALRARCGATQDAGHCGILNELASMAGSKASALPVRGPGGPCRSG